MEIKILHCSDIHLDAPFRGIWDRGNAKREEQREVFSGICKTARDEKVDLMLIAGDLFEWSRFNPDTIGFIKSELHQLNPIPVYIAPGNEDPCTPDSPWVAGGWPPNTVIFSTNRFKAEEIAEKKVIIYGAANRTAEDTAEPLKSLHLKKKDALHIALFHGSDAARPVSGKSSCLPFSPDELAASGVHYAALGHIHQMREILPSATRGYYCGAPDYLAFDENGDRGIIVARISPQGNEIRFVATGRRKLCTETVECDGFGSPEQLTGHIRKIAEEKQLSSTITKIVLRGYTVLQIDSAALAEELKDHFFHVIVKNETWPSYDLEGLMKEKSTRGTFARTLVHGIASLEGHDREKEHVGRQALNMGLDAFASRKGITI